MSRIFIDIEIEEIKLVERSNYEKFDDTPLERSKEIIVKGIPKLSNTYAHETINFNADGEKVDIPTIITLRIKSNSGLSNKIGDLYFYENFKDYELGVDEPNQFEALIYYSEERFQSIWDFIGCHTLGQVVAFCSIQSPSTENRGYTPYVDVKKSSTWPLIEFTLSRYAKKA